MQTETDLFGQPASEEKLKSGKLDGYARRPGSGPAGETCGSCVHCCKIGKAGKYKKCDVIRFRWTHGPGTDIRKKSPACEMWKGHGTL